MQVDIVSGYLGAGKTTFISRLIETDPDPSRLVVLVNEFGELGIDGLLLSGAEGVVELSSGCICCTLRMDFRTQILEIARDRKPERLLIEPTGIATTGQVLKALEHGSLAGIIDGVRVFVLVDATTFAERLRESPAFFTSQVKTADLIILNKTDLVPDSRVTMVRGALESISPGAWIVPSVRGQVSEAIELPPYRPPREAPESEALQGFASVSRKLLLPVDGEALTELFQELRAGGYGQIERAKALAETEKGWLRLDLAGDTLEEQPSGPLPEGRLVVIGQNLEREKLDQAFERLCAAGSTKAARATNQQ